MGDGPADGAADHERGGALGGLNHGADHGELGGGGAEEPEGHDGAHHGVRPLAGVAVKVWDWVRRRELTELSQLSTEAECSSSDKMCPATRGQESLQ